MTFEVELNGRARTVSVERTDRGGRFRVTVDGERHLLDVARAGEFGLAVLAGVPCCVDNRSEKVTVARSRDLYITPGASRGEFLVNLEGRTIGVMVNGRRTRHRAEGTAHGHGEISIVAPMPGRVVRVLVRTGDAVTARQGVVVVEAMKMENELRAPRGGRVKEVSVTPGTSVEAGRILAVIE
jgi:biotin carboxyl carrier protein